MVSFLTRRLAYMALTLLLVSFVSFIIIQAAPGDYAEIYAAKKAATGAIITQAEIEATRVQLGLDKPWYEQYWPLGLTNALARRFRLQLGVAAAGRRSDLPSACRSPSRSPSPR